MDPAKLTALAAQWDEAVADAQRLGDFWAAAPMPRFAHVARGRARQLADCADELRALIAKETP